MRRAAPTRCSAHRARRSCRYGRAAASRSRPAAIPRPEPRPSRGGTMRSCAGTTTRSAFRSRAAGRPGPSTRHCPRPGRSSPYQPPRHSRATGMRQRHAVIEPILERDEAQRRGAVLRQLGKAREFAQHQQRILRGKQRLQHVDRHFAERGIARRRSARRARPAAAPAPRARHGNRHGVASSASAVTSSGRRVRERQRQQPAHAIAEHHRRGARGLARDLGRRLQPPVM